MIIQSKMSKNMSVQMREMGAAGKFYAARKGVLEREVAVFLESAPEIPDLKQIFGIIVPNDPYTYCAGVAARAYRPLLDHDFDYVVVISPSHHVYFEEISVYNGNAYKTLLGEVPVATDIVAKLADQHTKIISSQIGHESDEHGIEVQLPFLQHIFSDFKLVPIIMGNQDIENITALSAALATVFRNKKALFVASSNLSSNHPYERAAIADKAAMDTIEKFDTKKLMRNFQDDTLELSGGGAVISVLNACRELGATKAQPLLYRSSGDMGASKKRVTGYSSFLIHS